MNDHPKKEENEVVQRLENLEKRIAKLETLYQKSYTPSTPSKLSPKATTAKENNFGDLLEHKISQNWFAKVGVIAIIISFAFLLTFKFENLPAYLPLFLGYILVSGIYLLAYLWRESNAHISGQLVGGGLALLFFTTMRLRFFSDSLIIQDNNLEVFLLYLVVAAGILLAVRRKSIFLAGFSSFIGYLTAVVSDTPYVTFTSISLMAGLTVYLSLKYKWRNLIYWSIIFAYLAHFEWFIGNPVLGNSLSLQKGPGYNLIFILFYAALFSLNEILQAKQKSESAFTISSSFLNCGGSYGLILILTLTTFMESMTIINLVASILFIGISIVFWMKHRSIYSTFFYSMLGFTALSVTIIAEFTNPEFFILLGWQSIAVIVTAILFRSKFIIVANFIIYVIILFSYLAFANEIDAMILSFGIISLISARILNWKKQGLMLQTELMRIAYLGSAFFIIPFSFFKLFPKPYISLSWIGLTLFYYIMGLLLKNIKYRWMAILTLLMTIGYVLIVDLINLDPEFRIISFLVLGVVLITISIIYNKKNEKKERNNADIKEKQ